MFYSLTWWIYVHHILEDKFEFKVPRLLGVCAGSWWYEDDHFLTTSLPPGPLVSSFLFLPRAPSSHPSRGLREPVETRQLSCPYPVHTFCCRSLGLGCTQKPMPVLVADSGPFGRKSSSPSTWNIRRQRGGTDSAQTPPRDPEESPPGGNGWFTGGSE